MEKAHLYVAYIRIYLFLWRNIGAILQAESIYKNDSQLVVLRKMLLLISSNS